MGEVFRVRGHEREVTDRRDGRNLTVEEVLRAPALPLLAALRRMPIHGAGVVLEDRQRSSFVQCHAA